MPGSLPRGLASLENLGDDLTETGLGGVFVGVDHGQRLDQLLDLLAHRFRELFEAERPALFAGVSMDDGADPEWREARVTVEDQPSFIPSARLGSRSTRMPPADRSRPMMAQAWPSALASTERE